MLAAVLRSALAALLAGGLVAGCALRPVTFPNATPITPQVVTAWRTRPAGGGPFPAVVLLHGCHGVSASTARWARWLTERGYVALVVDSFTTRGIADDCTPRSVELPPSARFDDAVGALRFLHTQPDVDRERVGVIGWSAGGVFAMSVVNGPSLERQGRRGVAPPAPGFRAAIGVYPGGCFSLIGEQVIRPLLVLVGDADDWTPAGVCAEMVAAMRARGAPAEIVVYPGAHHYFDVVGQPRAFLADVVNRYKPGGCCGATVGYDARADADAHRRVAELFARHLGR
jgi:dienelactone hydrolase